MKFKYFCILILAFSLCMCKSPSNVNVPSEDPSSEQPVSADPSADVSSDPSREPGTECELLSMTILCGDERIATEIDHENKTIKLKYFLDQYGTLENCTAEVTLSDGATINPNPSIAMDFMRSTVLFKVTSEDKKNSVRYTLTSEAWPAPMPGKPMIMWIDAVNAYRFLNTKEAVEDIVATMAANGFNGVAMEVKAPESGDVLYLRSDHLGYARSIGNTVISQDFDLLQAMIDACHSHGMKLTVSYCIFTFTYPTAQKSIEYYEKYLKDAYCRQLLTTGIEDIRENPLDVIFLNPVHPNVKPYVLSMVEEIVRNYDIDGFALDYCRYPNIRSDFSDWSRAAFEEYIGEAVENWPSDIMTVTTDDNFGLYREGNHVLFQKWMAWRATVIQGYVKDIRDVVKSIKPGVDLEYWAACWFQYRNEVGQNWGSYEKNWASTHYSWANSDYDKAGFAEYLDIFHLGNYVSKVYGASESSWSMEYFTGLARSVVGDACTMYNSFGVYTGIPIEEAVYYSYMNYPGVMIFELGAIAGNKRWTNVQRGYTRAMHELGEYNHNVDNQ